MHLYIGKYDQLPKPIDNCLQELKLVESSQLKRIANGELVKVRGPQKLWTKINGQNKYPLKNFHLELGGAVKIGCMQKLWKKVSSGKLIKLNYLVCENSIQGHDREGNLLCHLINDQEITIPEGVEFISYQPWLDMMITSLDTDDTHWEIEAEEI